MRHRIQQAALAALCAGACSIAFGQAALERAPPDRPATQQASTYGPTRADETLSEIADRLAPAPGRTTLARTIAALFTANPRAFAGGDPDRLIPGSVLRVPDADAIAAADANTGRRILRGEPAPVAAAETLRRRPGQSEAPPAPPPRGVPRRTRQPAPPEPGFDPNRRGDLAAVAVPQRIDGDTIPVPDRWRLIENLGITTNNWWDPYGPNTLKADRPVIGNDWFFSLSMISDGIVEPRRVPTPVGIQTTDTAGALDVFGADVQTLYANTGILALVFYQGDTTFKPPDWEFRLTPVYNINYARVDERRALRIDPDRGITRTMDHFGIQEAFVDKHLRNVSDRYDFDSVRVGIQPFSSDFRGFLFQDQPLGIRLFGNRDNNRFQYNLAAFRRMEKDTNSGLNEHELSPRKDDVVAANVYWQDWPWLGYFSQWTVVYNRNREADREPFFDDNGFLARPASLGREAPRNYDVTYLGYNADGHVGWLNVTWASYLALGHESAGTFTKQPRHIRAGFAAVELSRDYSWIRLRAQALWASADSDPFDDTAEGFDAIFENPIFAGADTSYWFRQSVPLIGGGGVVLSVRNGLLNSLRHSKEHGQSNFANPGTRLIGVGADLDLTPELRLSFNVNDLGFVSTETLEVARNQGGIDQRIGLDASAAIIYRPLMSQNIVFRLSAAGLVPGAGFEDLYPNQDAYSVLANLVLTY